MEDTAPVTSAVTSTERQDGGGMGCPACLWRTPRPVYRRSTRIVSSLTTPISFEADARRTGIRQAVIVIWSEGPLPHGRHRPRNKRRNKHGEARRRRHGVSGMSVANTPTCLSQVDPHRVESDNSDFFRGRRPADRNPTGCNCYLERRHIPAFG